MNSDQLEVIGQTIIGVGSLVISLAEFRRDKRRDALISAVIALYLLWKGISEYRT
jgi:hypothetical protein